MSNFPSLEVVGCASETPLQVGENLNKITERFNPYSAVILFVSFEYLCYGDTVMINILLFQCGEVRCQNLTSTDVRFRVVRV